MGMNPTSRVRVRSTHPLCTLRIVSTNIPPRNWLNCPRPLPQRTGRTHPTLCPPNLGPLLPKPAYIPSPPSFRPARLPPPFPPFPPLADHSINAHPHRMLPPAPPPTRHPAALIQPLATPLISGKLWPYQRGGYGPWDTCARKPRGPLHATPPTPATTLSVSLSDPTQPCVTDTALSSGQSRR